MKTPAVLYAAKSTQDKHASIPTQLRNGREKAEEEDWDVIGEFTDERFSAYSGNRGPGLKAATELAASAAEERGVVCMLVAQHSDRFARGAGDEPGASDSLMEVWIRMRRRNVHLRSFQNDSMMHKPVTVAVASEQAYEESKRKSEAVKDGIHRRRHERGKPHGGKRRYGYRYVKGEGLVAVEAELAIVRRMAEEFFAGASDSQIMRGLLADNIPTALGGKWHQATVADILTNPLYAGKLRAKGEVVDGIHEPAYDWETFQRLGDLRAARNKQAKGRGRPPAGPHLFRKGMLRCGVCGGSMVPRTTRPGKTRPNRKISETYYCYERLRDSSLCSMTPVKRAEVDSAVYRYFELVGLDVEATRDQLAEARDQRLAEVRALTVQAEAEKQRAEERMARVRRDYMDDKLSAEDWADFRDELTAGLKAAGAEVERLAEQAAEVEAWGEFQDAERDTLAKLADLRKAMAGEINDAEGTDAVRAALSRLFEHFVIRRPESGQRIHAELAWLGDLYIEPVPREQAIESYTSLRPVFVRELLYGEQTNQESPSSCPPPRLPTASATPMTRRKRSTPRRT
ncbi:MAG TPA: recombinase family protein [Solirubrobacterales bacterium]|nr:recombinase family protein [Solirubrobacterales bacterium]